MRVMPRGRWTPLARGEHSFVSRSVCSEYENALWAILISPTKPHLPPALRAQEASLASQTTVPEDNAHLLGPPDLYSILKSACVHSEEGDHVYQAPYCSVTEDTGITSDGLICRDPDHTFRQRETQAGAGRGERGAGRGRWTLGSRSEG